MTEHQTWTAYHYTVVDVEGNGQQPPDLVELAAVPIIGGQIGNARTWMVKPPRPITPVARSFHQIGNEDVADAPDLADVADEIRQQLNGTIFVAHNAHVELSVVVRALPGFKPGHVIDTLKLARRLIPGQVSYRLGNLVEAFGLAGDIDAELRPHRAAYDAITCARLLVRLASPQGGIERSLADLLGREGQGDPAETLF